MRTEAKPTWSQWLAATWRSAPWLLLLPTVALPILTGTAGVVYAAGAGFLTLVFLLAAIDVYRAKEGLQSDKACKHLFGFSIYWLFAVFALILVERLFNLPVLM